MAQISSTPVEASGSGLSPTSPQTPMGTKLLLAVGVAIVVVAAVAAAFLAFGGKSEPSADQQIETAIRDFYSTLDKDGFVAANAKTCAADRAELAALSPQAREQFQQATLKVRIDKVRDVIVTGNDAKATIDGTLTLTVPGEAPNTENSTDEHLRNEDGVWKICSAPANKR
ncbi:Rv0361 family membrane protein [Nocardia camponoti]|uniref:DUF4878 domain-containing protein n=1 Tax=Nocardia camponoti TaxID=1616106 RepID=A0A917QL72_9NOCA|nr:hypothetical protein [Nocardia camponoti]GGK55990.1 hypothetical protein GCM10011591_29970 [Nocardia camponoti]